MPGMPLAYCMKEDEIINMALAVEEARQALAEGEFPVGCVMAEGERILARGRRRKSSGSRPSELDHAEILTLHSLLDQHPGIDAAKVTVYSTLEPCLMCYATMLLSGIRRFVWAYEDVMGGGVNLPLASMHPLYQDMRVSLQGGVLRRASLALFQEYFRTGTYWQDSLLARYTLEQSLDQGCCA